jgi:hypothetical protein
MSQQGQAPATPPGHKKPSDIIRSYMLRQTGDPKQADQAINYLATLVQQKKARMIQFGNTVFWANQAAPGELEVHIFTEEAPQTLVKRLPEAAKWAKAHGFKKIFSVINDPGTIELVKMSKLPFNLSQTSMRTAKGAMPAYKLEMDL